jgi:hypothetical protein
MRVRLDILGRRLPLCMRCMSMSHASRRGWYDFHDGSDPRCGAIRAFLAEAISTEESVTAKRVGST